jgi:hypothetical protein
MSEEIKENCDGFKKELNDLINRWSMENGSDTPDFILVAYLYDCLMAYDKAVNARQKWYRKELL